MLSKDWAGAGHSQGGSTAWKLAEQVQQLLNSNKQHTSGRYLGSVALSPVPNVRDVFYWMVNNVFPLKEFHRYVTVAEIPSIAVALKNAYPAFDLSTLFAEPLRKRLELTDHAQMCTNAMMGLTADLSIEELVSPTFSSDARTEVSNNLLTKWQDATQVTATGSINAPLLVVQGMADTFVLPAIMIASSEEACRTPGYEVHLSLYDSQDHSPTVVATAPEWLD